jgi:hypothetical protein
VSVHVHPLIAFLSFCHSSEREALWDMVQTIGALVMGDKGDLSATL